MGKTKEQLLRELNRIEHTKYESFSADTEAYWDLVRRGAEIQRELRDRFDWRPGRPTGR